jgi:hypothetical protein
MGRLRDVRPEAADADIRDTIFTGGFRCRYCNRELEESKQSTAGVTPPSNENASTTIIPNRKAVPRH